MGDLPSGIGLGSSSSFLVSLLTSLYSYKNEIVSNHKLAEDASHIVMDILKEACGKQDQYASAFGGLNHLEISTSGKVTVTSINITHENIKKLEKNLMLFFTGFTRSSVAVLEDQKKIAKNSNKDKDDSIYAYYHKIKKIGYESKRCFESGNLKRFGELLDEHWKLKKGISTKMSNLKIDKWYQMAMDNGALGGKIVGAGGGGFLMFYIESNHDKLKEIMEKEGLVYTPFIFDFDGARVIYNE